MTVAFVSAASETQNTGSTTRQIPAPANIAEGNLLIAIFSGHINFTISARPSGWANVILVNDGTDDTLCIEWKIATAGDVGATSFTWTTVGAAGGGEIMLQYSGTHQTNPFNKSASNSSSNGTSHATSSITPDVDGCMILAVFAADSGSNTTWSGGGDNERADVCDSGFFASAAAYDTFQTTAAAVSKTGTSSQSDTGCHAILAIQPVISIGTANITEAGDTLSAAGVVAVAGTANISEAGDSISAGGAVAVAGVFNQTEAGDTLSAAGVVPVAGAANLNEDGDSLQSQGVVLISGTANITEAADVLSNAQGTVLISGDANITEAADTLSALGVVAVFGIAIITEDGDTLIGVGIVEGGETGPVLGVNDTPGFVLFMTASAFYYLLKNAGEDVGLDAPDVDNAEAWAQWLNGN